LELECVIHEIIGANQYQITLPWIIAAIGRIGGRPRLNLRDISQLRCRPLPHPLTRSLAGRSVEEEDRRLHKQQSGGASMQSKAQIDQLLRQKCDAKEIPGVVAIAATGKEIIYENAFGKRDLGKDDAMTTDSVFWIASMTKAVTSAGAMQLVEQGKLSLDEPIGKVLPDLASPQVLEGFDANGEPKLRPAKKPITLRHLMTHTAGFCYGIWNGDAAKYLEKTGLPAVTTCKNDSLKVPLSFDPGTRWD
jgi:CubicO group peptidase (beta-lactamase class C family)